MVERARAAASRGLTMDQIARFLGTSAVTLAKRRKVVKQLEEAILDGRTMGVLNVANALFDKAMAGDTTAMIFFLKAQGGWRENIVLQHIGGGPDDPAISIRQDAQLLHVLASLSPDELRDMISLLRKEKGQEQEAVPLDAPKQITLTAKNLTIEKKPNKTNGKTNGGSVPS
jgi:hypothetical protein